MKKILIVLLTILALSVMLFAEPKDTPKKDNPCNDCNEHGMMMGPRDGSGPHGGMGMENRKDIMEELKLTKEQMKKLETLKTDYEKIINTKQAELENLMIDKHLAMKADKFDQVKAINKQIADLELFIDNARVDHHAAMLKELTPEQRDKFKEMTPMGRGMGMHQGMNKGPGQGKGMHKGMGNGCGGNCD